MGPDEIAEEVILAEMDMAYAEAQAAAARERMGVAQSRRTNALLELEHCGYSGDRLERLLQSAR